MIQQINLYQGKLAQTSTQAETDPYVYGLIALALLLIGFSMFLAWDLNSSKNDLKVVKQKLQTAETRVQLLQVQYPKQQVNTLLVEEISHSTKKLDNLTRIINLLTDKKSDQTQGFSRYFSALAKQSISEIWLNKININGQKNSLVLQGSTYNAEKIPVFLQALHLEPVFQGRNFAKLIMTQTEESENQIDFIVSTLAEDSNQSNDN